MSTTAWPALRIAATAASTNDRSDGSRCNSDVRDKNTRHGLARPAPTTPRIVPVGRHPMLDGTAPSLGVFRPVFAGVGGLLFQTGPEHDLAHRLFRDLAPHAEVGCGVEVPAPVRDREEII